jgi:hypothetical protein
MCVCVCMCVCVRFEVIIAMAKKITSSEMRYCASAKLHAAIFQKTVLEINSFQP